MNAPARAEKERLPGLDGLRALSVLAVIFYHLDAVGHFPAWTRPALQYGFHGVGVFFAISGYLITWLLLREEARGGGVSLRGFYFRRAMRILPPAYVYLAAVALAAALRPGAYPGLDGWADFTAAALFFRNLTYHAGSELTRHYWSLSIEEQFYLLWPLVFVLVPARRRFWLTAGLCLLAPAWRQLHMELFDAAKLNWSRADLRYDQILVGVAFALARHEGRFPALLGAAGRRAGTLLAAAGAVYLALVVWGGDLPGPLRPGGELARLAALGLVIHLVGAGQGGGFLRALEWPALAWIGRLSYSLYLWQQLFCVPRTGWALEAWPANLAATFALAAASYYLVERPALRLRGRLQARRPG
jgi:peptidoglycan/LPS O-acetylase OafA/YrhL